MRNEPDIRWKQRFRNFDRSVLLLREPIDRGIESLSDLEKEGTIQRFEFALELAWKCMKDYLEFGGKAISPVTPRTVVKEAYSAGFFPDGKVWIDMLDHRNLLSHTYDRETFREAVVAIRDRYLPAMEEFRQWLQQRMMGE